MKYRKKCCICGAFKKDDGINYHNQCGIYIRKYIEAYKEKIENNYEKVVTTKTKRVRKKILEYLEKVNIGDTFEIIDFINRTTKIGTTLQAIGNILSNMATKKEIIKVSSWKNNSPAIWKRNINENNNI